MVEVVVVVDWMGEDQPLIRGTSVLKTIDV